MRGASARGQIAMEYLMIFSITFFMIIPLLIIFITQTSTLEENIVNAQLEKISNEIVDTAKEVYYFGEPSQKTIRVTLPDNIKKVELRDYGIVFVVNRQESSFEFTKETALNLTGSIKSYEGVHIITIVAEENNVRIEDGKT
ncbi:MAG: hypothetical protein ACLFTH_00965 [Candidatus Woesearchaeota archaeon]